MTEENRRHGIAQELRQAESALKAARALRDLALYNDSLNRLYYALFHTLTALLLTVGVEPRRHRSLPQLLGAHFADLLGPADIVLVSRAATYRDLADYERSWIATPEIAAEAFAAFEPLMTRVREHLSKSGWAPDPQG